MKKYKVTTAKKAVQNGLVKEGDEIWVKAEIIGIKEFIIDAITEEAAWIICKNTDKESYIEEAEQYYSETYKKPKR